MSAISLRRFTLISILFLAAFLRLYRIDGYLEFLGDQGRDVVIVRHFLVNGDLMFIGPQTSIGNMYLGPWYYYLIAPALLVAGFNPIGPAILVALFGIATVWLLYHFTNRLFGITPAIIAAFLYAISPVIIKYTNFSWNPNIMPFFALLFVYSLYEIVFQKHYRHLILLSFSFVMAVNSHYLALLFLPFALVYLFFHFAQNRLPQSATKYISYSLAILIISILPLILFDLKHNGQNIAAITQFFSNRQTTVNLKFYKAIPAVYPLFEQIITRLVTAKEVSVGKLFTPIILVTILTTLIYLFRTNRPKASNYLFIGLWFLIGVAGLGLYKQHIYDHYFGFIFPSVFILLAVGLTTLISINRLIIVPATILVVYFTFLSYQQNPFRFPPNNQLATTQQIDQTILNHSKGQPFNLALLAKQNYDPPYRYFFEVNHSPLYLLSDRTTDQLFVICEPWQIECQPLGNPLWDIAAFGQASIGDQWNIGNIQIFKLIHVTK